MVNVIGNGTRPACEAESLKETLRVRAPSFTHIACWYKGWRKPYYIEL